MTANLAPFFLTTHALFKSHEVVVYFKVVLSWLWIRLALKLYFCKFCKTVNSSTSRLVARHVWYKHILFSSTLEDLKTLFVTLWSVNSIHNKLLCFCTVQVQSEYIHTHSLYSLVQITFDDNEFLESCINPKRCGLFGQLRMRGGPKVPSERWRSLDASISIQTKQTVLHMKADIFS